MKMNFAHYSEIKSDMCVVVARVLKLCLGKYLIKINLS